MVMYKREGNLIAVYYDGEFIGYAEGKDEAKAIVRDYEKEREEAED